MVICRAEAGTYSQIAPSVYCVYMIPASPVSKVQPFCLVLSLSTEHGKPSGSVWTATDEASSGDDCLKSLMLICAAADKLLRSNNIRINFFIYDIYK